MSSMTRSTTLITAVCRSMAIASGLVLAAHVLAGSALAQQEPTLKEVIKTILKHLARIIHEEVNIRPPGFDSARVCGASLRASLEQAAGAACRNLHVRPRPHL